MSEEKKNVMLYLNGRDKPSFRCDCKCNVFHTFAGEKETYYCNACDAKYSGEPIDDHVNQNTTENAES